MKITVLCAIFNLCFIQAYNQYNKTIEFISQDVNIKEILIELNSIEEVKLSYNHADLPLNNTVILEKKDYSVEELLNILSENNIVYQKMGKHIILKKSDKINESEIQRKNSSNKEPENVIQEKEEEEQNKGESLKSNKNSQISNVFPDELKAKSDNAVIENFELNDRNPKIHSYASNFNDAEKDKERKKMKIRYGITMGGKISIINCPDKEVYQIDNNFIIGSQFGFNANTSLSKKLNLQAGLLYSSKGGRFDGYKTDPFYEGMAEYKITTNYIEMPFVLKYKLLSKSYLYSILGIYVSYGFNGKIKMKTNFYNEINEEVFLLSWSKNMHDIGDFAELNTFHGIKRFDYGLAGGIELKLGNIMVGSLVKVGRNMMWESSIGESMRNILCELNITYLLF